MLDWFGQIDWPATAKFFATVLAPFGVAVLGYWIFLAQRKHEKDEKLRAERRMLYSQILSSLKEAGKATQPLPIAHALAPHFSELTLTAPDEVVQAAQKLISASLRTKKLRPLQGKPYTVKEIEEYTQSAEPQRQAHLNLLTEMRKDVLKGSRVSQKITFAGDLQNDTAKAE